MRPAQPSSEDIDISSPLICRRAQNHTPEDEVCISCGCDLPPRPRREIRPLDSQKLRPDEAVLIATEDALSHAESWLGWSGNAVLGLGSVWTPHKAMRRIAD